MARIPDNELERLKTNISLVRLVESQGYAVTKQGKDYAIRCPFHEGDDTPSLTGHRPVMSAHLESAKSLHKVIHKAFIEEWDPIGV